MNVEELNWGGLWCVVQLYDRGEDGSECQAIFEEYIGEHNWCDFKRLPEESSDAMKNAVEGEWQVVLDIMDGYLPAGSTWHTSPDISSSYWESEESLKCSLVYWMRPDPEYFEFQGCVNIELPLDEREAIFSILEPVANNLWEQSDRMINAYTTELGVIERGYCDRG